MISKKPDELVQTSETPNKKTLGRIWKLAAGVLGGVILLLAIVFGYLYAASPPAIRNPKFQHYHFRMQVVINGKVENFGDQKYQIGYSKDNCNAALTVQPIHFHDSKDQMVHIHWDGMTGGMVLKYYGWNYIGGMKGALGYKLNNLGDIQEVRIHGDYLPAPPKDARLYIFTGDESSYQERQSADFLHSDLEDFFGKKSNLPGEDAQASLLRHIFPKASAHGAEKHQDSDAAAHETEGEKLTRINNLIGNVVIFAQKDQPADQQVKDRFNDLEPLGDSTCGG